MSRSEGTKFESVVRCIRGFPFPNAPLFTPKNIVDALDHCPQDGDIVLCSYPKTGSTWMQYIVWQIVHKGEFFPDLNQIYGKLAPMMERTNLETYKNMEEPRIYKNHFLYHMLKENPKAKYIYIFRNPADILTSYYYFSNEIHGTTCEFNGFYEMFLKGEVMYGDFFDHFWSFYRKKENQNLLLVSYEDLKDDPKSGYLRIAKFLGDKYHETLVNNKELLEKIVKVTSFDHMKSLNLTLEELNDTEGKTVSFFRKGVVGDGKKTMSKQQLEKLQKKIKLRMAGSEFADLWCS